MEVNVVSERCLFLVVMLAPGGWRTTDSQGHALMYVLIRRQNSFTFAVCNTGNKAGLGLREYHFAKAECSPPKVKRNLSMVLNNIPLHRLSDR